jgi:hypothetical protein
MGWLAHDFVRDAAVRAIVDSLMYLSVGRAGECSNVSRWIWDDMGQKWSRFRTWVRQVWCTDGFAKLCSKIPSRDAALEQMDS